MRKSFKNCWLLICLLSTLAMVGCGGGGGSSVNPAFPRNTESQVSNEALAVREAVVPVLRNADTILGLGGGNASFRTSTGNVKEFDTTEIGNSVVNSLQTPQFLRAVISAVGGNIEGGLWENESKLYSYAEVATYSNGVYERTVYSDNLDDIIKNGKNSYGGSLEHSIIAYYKIEGCVADYDKENKIIRSLTINKGAKITVDDSRGFRFHDPYKSAFTPISFKGTINTDLTVKWEGNVETFESPKVFEYTGGFFLLTTGKDITADYKSYDYGLQSSKKISSKTTYTFSRLEMDLTEIHFSNHSGYYYDQEFNGNLKININGISGSVVVNKTIFVDARSIKSDGNGWIFNNEKQTYYSQDAYSYDEETGDEILDTSKPYYCYYNAVIVKKPLMNLKYASPVNIALSGNVTDYIYGIDSWHPEQEYIDYEDKIEKYNGTLKNLTLKINKMSGNLSDGYVIDDAEAHLETGDYKTDEVIRLGNQELAFNAAKIDVKGIKFNSKWLNIEDLDKKCLGNAIASLSAEETNNNVVINAKCDVNAKTAYLKMVNNGNYIYKENTDVDRVLEFNFRTVEIDATNVDFFENNKFEGALLEVTGVEKDDLKTTSVRNYKVVNGKLVLVSSDDKKVPNLPDVEISPLPEGLEDDSNSIEVAVSEAKEDLEKPTANKQTKNNNPDESLKLVEKNGKKIGQYEKKAAGNNKKIDSNITAKDKIICSVTFYGNNEFTILFIIDYTNSASPLIKGSIFKGMRNNVTMDTVENRVGLFAGKNGKITLVTSEGSSEVSVQ